MRILVTGGCGFIGSAVIRHLMRATDHSVVNVDKMTYAASLDALEDAAGNPRHLHLRADITNAAAIGEIFETHRPDAVMHLAAESHVDRSIDGPADFITTNVVGTFVMLDAARAYWSALAAGAPKPPSASTISRPTRCSARSAPATRRFTRRPPTIRAAPIRPAKLAPITSCAPGSTPSACRPSSPTRPITTAPGSFPRS